MTTDTLLPQNATEQELALEKAIRPNGDVQAGIELIRTAKESPPDDWLYWLIWEYGLEVLLPYLADPRQVLEDGIRWQRIRGTPDSLSMAFAWLGLGDTVIEEEATGGRHWFEYQLDPQRVPTRAELRNLIGLARLSQPLRSRLSRVFHGLDNRRAVWDYTAWSDGSLWSDHGGVWDDELGVDLSFGRTHTSVAYLGDPEIYTQHIRDITSLTRYIDKLSWDENDFDEPYPTLNYSFGGEQHVTVHWTHGAGRNMLVSDGRFIADGSMQAATRVVAEANQYPASVKVEDVAEIERVTTLAIIATDKLYNTVNTDFYPRLS